MRRSIGKGNGGARKNNCDKVIDLPVDFSFY